MPLFLRTRLHRKVKWHHAAEGDVGVGVRLSRRRGVREGDVFFGTTTHVQDVNDFREVASLHVGDEVV